MLIKKLYKTKITCSHYHAAVTYEGAITVTVKLTDFNDNPVVGKTATISVNAGNFKDSYGLDMGTSFEGTTDNNGEFSVDYYITTHGLITFECNSSITQIHVGGWRLESLYKKDSSNYVYLYVNELIRMCELKVYRNGFNFTSTSQVLNSKIIPANYRPVVTSTGACVNPEYSVHVDDDDGSIYATVPAKGKHTINSTMLWHY